jgi:ADP-heptose:LPS heptosyltransferase
LIVGPRRDTVAVPRAPRVLIVRPDHIGDLALSTAVLHPLREALQPSRLDLLVAPWAAPLIERHPAVDGVIAFATPWWLAARGAPWPERAAAWSRLPSLIARLRAERYDVAIDLRGDLRQIVCFLALGGMPIRASSSRTGGRRLLTHIAAYDPSRHEVEHAMAIVATLGVPTTEPPVLDLGPLPPLPEAIEQRVAAHDGPGGYMVLALRGVNPNREWPAEQAALLADMAAEQLGLAPIVVGSPKERPLAAAVMAKATVPVLDLTGAVTLRELATLCRRATVTVAVDSGPMHVAAAAGGPVVGLFGIGDPVRIGPFGARTTIATVGAPCGCQPPSCTYTSGAGRCMRQLTPAAVLQAIRRVAPLTESASHS